ncbi:MAG: response regulator, partial [Hyphomicrobiaceae bacterium]
GQVWLDVEHTRGACFRLRLPLGELSQEAAAQLQSSRQQGVPKKVLVIDDEKDVADLIAEILTKDGFEVAKVGSGLQALQYLKNSSFDAILSDLNMPEMDGPEFFEALSFRHPELLHRMGFITGDTMGIQSQRVLRESKRPYLEKPVTPSELRSLVNDLVEPTEGVS